MSDAPAEGFTPADKVALLAVELGVSLTPWQFDFVARCFPDRDTGRRPPVT